MQDLISLCALAAVVTVGDKDVDGEDYDADDDFIDVRDKPHESDDDELIFVAVQDTDDVNEQSCQNTLNWTRVEHLTRTIPFGEVTAAAGSARGGNDDDTTMMMLAAMPTIIAANKMVQCTSVRRW